MLERKHKTFSSASTAIVYRVSKSTWIMISITIVLFSLPPVLRKRVSVSYYSRYKHPLVFKAVGSGQIVATLRPHSSLVTAIRRDYRWNRFSLLGQEEGRGGGGGDERRRMRNEERHRWWSFLAMSSRKNRPRRPGTGGGIRLRDRAGCIALWRGSLVNQVNDDSVLTADNSFIKRQ